MRTIIAGGRDFQDAETLTKALEITLPYITCVLCGGAKGADSMGKVWAEFNNIPVEMYPALWDKYGKSAGYRRNVEMAGNADGLIAFWDGKSKGTKHMIDIALNKGLVVHIFNYKGKRLIV